MVAMIACAALASGCISYASYSYTWSGDHGVDGETVGVLLGIEAAIGIAVAVGMVASDDKRADNWGIDLVAGMVTPFVIDAAIALGVGTSDFVADAHAPD
jgi:hypothetical protein